MATHAAFLTISGTGYTAPSPAQPQMYSTLTTVAGGAGVAVTYRMRGFDQNGAVNGIVYWNSTEIDSDASDYSGSAGPVVDIVVVKVTGS